MKKRVLSLVLSIVMVLCCMQYAIFGGAVVFAAETDYTAPWGSAVVDGTKDAAYSNAAAIGINKDKKNAAVSGQATGTVYTLFDGDYLYVFAEVTDPTPTYNIGASEVQVDVEGFNLYLDFLYEDSASYSDYYYGNPWSLVTREQGRIRTGFISSTSGNATYTTTITNGSGDNRYAVCDKGGFDALVVAKQTSTGYNTEFRIALSDSLRAKLASRDATIGIGFQINDNQDGANDYAPGSLTSGQSSYREAVCWNDSGINNEWKTGSKDFTTMTLQNRILPDADYIAPYGTATVDGSKDAIYSSANVIAVNKAKNNVLADGATAQVYTLFDAEYLYFFAEVADAAVVTGVDPSAVVKDKEGMIFFLDYLTLEDTAYKTEPWGAIDDEQGRIHANFIGNAEGDATYNTSPYVFSDKGHFETQMVSVQTSVGYNIELRVKLSESVQSQLADGIDPIIGVGFQVNDDTDGDYVRNNVCWDDAAMNKEWISGYGCSVFKPMVLKDFGGQFDAHSIVVDPGITGGTISTDKTTAVVGETVRITAEADAAMAFDWTTLTVNGDSCSNGYFTMPDEDVVISGQFVPYSGGKDENIIKVLTQNVLNNARYDNDHGLTASIESRAMAITQLVNTIKPDSVGFQEVCQGSDKSWPKWLADNLTDYAYVGFGREFTGDVNTVSEDFANNVCSGEATPIFYLKDKFDLLEGGTRWLSDTPDVPGADWGASYPRILTWAVLKNKQTGQVYAHINTHTDFSYYAQRNSMTQIIGKIAGLQAVYGSGLPVVITADWNMAMTSTAYNDMVTNTTVPIADSAFCLPEEERINWGTTFHDLGKITGGTLPIDMAFITHENAKVFSYEVLHPSDYGFNSFCLSDHYGVCITFDPTLPAEAVLELPDTLMPADITASYGTAELDGYRDPIVYKGSAGNVKIMSDKLWSDDLAGGQVWMSYDDNFLYILAEVQDPTPASSVVFASGSLPNEGITFMLDFLNNDEGDTNYLISSEQGMLTLGYSSAVGTATQGTARQFGMDCDRVIVNTATGYNVEVKVALTQQLKDRLASGGDVAISGGVQLHDDWDNDGTRDITMYTDINLDNEWRNISTSNGGCQTFPEIILEARPKSYTVSLDAGSGTVDPTSLSVYYGLTMGTLPTPIRTGYEFAGWFDDEGIQYTAQTVYNIDGDITLTAKWTVYVCEHTYTSEITTAATCTTTGVKTYTCTVCGDSYTETIAATGHTPVAVPGMDATCTESGLTEGSVCDVCGEVLTRQEEIPAVGHTPVAVPGMDTTCTESGLTEGSICDVCGEVLIEQEVITAPGHSFADGVCSECGAADPDYVPVVNPTITPAFPTMALEEEVKYNIYYTVSDLGDYTVNDMGLLVFDSKVENPTYDTAKSVVPGATISDGYFMVQSGGIPAKEMADDPYFVIYIKLADGSYAYSMIFTFNAVDYVQSVLASSAYPEGLKKTCVALMNYGADAQVYFGYKTDSLMNSFLTADQQAMVSEYSSSMVSSIVKADASKVGEFASVSGGFSNIVPSVSLEGAFAVNYYFIPGKTVESDMTFYCWDAKTYNSVDVLTKENAINAETLNVNDAGQYLATFEGIAAKDLDSTVYVAAVYESNGVTYCTGVLAVSVSVLSTMQMGSDANLTALAEGIIVYGDCAKAYFSN